MLSLSKNDFGGQNKNNEEGRMVVVNISTQQQLTGDWSLVKTAEMAPLARLMRNFRHHRTVPASAVKC